MTAGAPELPAPRPKPLGELLTGLAVTAWDGDRGVVVRGQVHDSRQAGPGLLFAAFRGTELDGHRFLPDAARRGATAAIVERPPAELRAELGLGPELTLVQVPDARLARGWVAASLHDHPSRALTVVGVTGTDGKTTTSSLIHAILTSAGRPAGLVSTVGARIGEAWLDTGLHATTPEPEELQALLAAMRDAGLEVAVVETSSHGLAQHRVAGVDYDVAVLTNVSPEHLDYHRDLAEYREAKAMLFRGLGASEGAFRRTAVLNADDSSFAFFRAIPAPRHLAYSLHADSGADLRLLERLDSADGLRFRAATPDGEVELASPLTGDYNIANILAAMGAALALGVPLPAIPAGVAALAGVPGRMEAVDRGQAFRAVVDFAHTPQALEAVLTAGRRQVAGAGGRVIAVFGCAGRRDPGKREAMGHVAGRLADVTVLTAEDPRDEDLDAIIEQSAAGLRAEGRVEGEGFFRRPDRFQAIRLACDLAGAADLVLVCGKGHEQSLCFGLIEYPWDDREALAAALTGGSYGHLPTSAGA